MNFSFALSSASNFGEAKITKNQENGKIICVKYKAIHKKIVFCSCHDYSFCTGNIEFNLARLEFNFAPLEFNLARLEFNFAPLEFNFVEGNY